MTKAEWSENGKKAALARWGGKPPEGVKEKRCSSCRETKQIEEFPPRRGSRDGYAGLCKSCKFNRDHAWYLANKKRSLENSMRWARENPHKAIKYHRKSRYGVTPDKYREMVDGQGAKCAICGDGHRKLHIDHDHETGVVRGLLCGLCNRGVGCFGDDPKALMSAANYISKHKVLKPPTYSPADIASILGSAMVGGAA